MTATSSWEDAFEALRQEFLRRVPDRTDAIRSCCDRLDRDADDGAALRELMRRIHSLGGTAETYGYRDVSGRCREAEAACGSLLREGVAPGMSVLAEWRALGVSIEQELSGPHAASPVRRPESSPDAERRVRDILIVEGGREILDTVQQELIADGLRVARSKPEPPRLLPSPLGCPTR